MLWLTVSVAAVLLVMEPESALVVPAGVLMSAPTVTLLPFRSSTPRPAEPAALLPMVSGLVLAPRAVLLPSWRVAVVPAVEDFTMVPVVVSA